VALYSAQSRITQFHLQIKPCLPLGLPCTHSPDSATTDLWWCPAKCSLLLIHQPRKDERLSWLIYSRRFTHIWVVTLQLWVECRTGKVRRSKTNVLPLRHAT